MKVEIFIVTYAKDAEWLKCCLKSISKFATGFSGVTVVAPEKDIMVFAEMCGAHNAKLCLFNEAPPPRGHLHHNVQKCRADEWCPEAEFILHIDSDCIFREPVTPEDYFVNGKPVLLMQEYAILEKDFPGFPWRSRVEKALGEHVQYEFMRRHPMVNPIGVYLETRNWVERVQGKPFDAYVLDQKPDYPAGFAEFNTIGHVAWTKFHDSYHWIDVGREPWPRSKVIQFWSHGGLKSPQQTWLDGKLITVAPESLISETLR